MKTSLNIFQKWSIDGIFLCAFLTYIQLSNQGVAKIGETKHQITVDLFLASPTNLWSILSSHKLWLSDLHRVAKIYTQQNGTDLPDTTDEGCKSSKLSFALLAEESLQLADLETTDDTTRRKSSLSTKRIPILHWRSIPSTFLDLFAWYKGNKTSVRGKKYPS